MKSIFLFSLVVLFVILLVQTSNGEDANTVDVLSVRQRREIILTSCARMDTPILKKVAQASCVTSCKYQNCGTGTCKHRGKRPVCVCSRCGKGGGEWPQVPSKGKGK